MRGRLRITLAAAAISVIVAPVARAVSPTVVSRVSRSVVLVRAGDRLGTAFAYGAPGYYLTNAHVVADADQVGLVAPDGRTYQATVVASDSGSDVARLRSGLELPVLAPAPRLPAPGDAVMTVGSPDGLQGSVATGIVSAVNRPERDQTMTEPVAMIQVNMAVNPGNSGGPLVDGAGHVLGIVTAKEASDQGIGFAIPIATASGAVGDSSTGSAPGKRQPTRTSGPRTPGAGAPVSGGTTSTIILIVVLFGMTGLAFLLWRRTRQGGSSEPPVEVRFRNKRRLEDLDDVAVVIRRRANVRDSSRSSNSQPSEEPWT